MVDVEKMRAALKEIVKREDVKHLIGYENGTYGWRTAPSFAKTEGDVDRLVFSPLCTHNLLTYMILEEKAPPSSEEKKKTAIVVKGCDARAAIQLIQEKTISRDEVILIGVRCTGVVAPKKMKRMFPKSSRIVFMEEKADTYSVHFEDREVEIPREDLVFDNCKTCVYKTPPLYDILIADETTEAENADLSAQNETYPLVEEFEGRSEKQRWEFWKEEVCRCIRCYSCRNGCPLCSCKSCMSESLNPVWIRRSVDLSENAAFHIMRALHTAGRCIGCGNCERVCPVDIPLTLIYKKVEKDIVTLFGHRAGLKTDEKQPLSVYSFDDSNENIL